MRETQAERMLFLLQASREIGVSTSFIYEREYIANPSEIARCIVGKGVPLRKTISTNRYGAKMATYWLEEYAPVGALPVQPSTLRVVKPPAVAPCGPAWADPHHGDAA